MFLRSAFGRPYWIVLRLVCLMLGSGNSSAAWQASLIDAEIQALSAVATNHFSTQTLNSSSVNNKAKQRDNGLGVEVLLIELQEVKFRSVGDPRLAEIYIFDYATDTASVMLVEVENQSVISSRQIDNIHLPLNEHEVATATQLLLSDTTLMAELALEYEKQAGKTLDSLQQLDMKVSIWSPGANQQRSHDCKLTRCALVSLFTENHYNFSVEPVVNLSTSSVYLDWVQ